MRTKEVGCCYRESGRKKDFVLLVGGWLHSTSRARATSFTQKLASKEGAPVLYSRAAHALTDHVLELDDFMCVREAISCMFVPMR